MSASTGPSESSAARCWTASATNCTFCPVTKLAATGWVSPGGVGAAMGTMQSSPSQNGVGDEAPNPASMQPAPASAASSARAETKAIGYSLRFVASMARRPRAPDVPGRPHCPLPSCSQVGAARTEPPRLRAEHAPRRSSPDFGHSVSRTTDPERPGRAKMTCQPAMRSGLIHPNIRRASFGARFTQPWLVRSPNRSCQNAPGSA